jgi:hypothetical protein
MTALRRLRRPRLRVRGTSRSGLARRLSSPRRHRSTYALAAGAVTASAAVIGLEVARIWHRAPAPSPDADPAAAARAAAGDAVAVIREGYRETSARENAVLNMLVAFLVTFAGARTTTYLIRSGRRFGPMGNVVVGRRHIHHFVPGIVLALVAGTASIAVRDEQLDKWLAIPFGAGAALILDESALLLELEDVYWSEEGVLSLQIAFAGAALLAVAALVGHLLHRGEPAVAQRHRATAPAREPAARRPPG